MKRVTTIIASLFMCSFIFTVSAQKNFMEGWDGGDAVDAGSEPNHFGWISDNPDLVWTETDSEDVGTIRFSTKLASQCQIYGQFPLYYDSHRLLIMRWDGNDVNYFAYKLSGLEAGKNYKFEWVYCWYNNGDYYIPRVAVNKNPVSVITAPNTIDGIGEVSDDVFYQYFFGVADNLPDENDIDYSQKMTVHPGEFEFTVPESGDYYLTFTCTQVIDQVLTDDGLHIKGPMGMVGGFSVTETGSSSGVESMETDPVSITVEDGRIVVKGSDTYRISTIVGSPVANVNARLDRGIYLVQVNGKAHKVIVK